MNRRKSDKGSTTKRKANKVEEKEEIEEIEEREVEEEKVAGHAKQKKVRHEEQKEEKEGKKGGLLDPHIPNSHEYKVYKDYAIQLHQMSKAQNLPKFFIIQLVVNSVQKFFVWTRWGMGENVAHNKMFPCDTLEEAKQKFEQRFMEKTGNNWDDLGNFKPKQGKFLVDYSAPTQGYTKAELQLKTAKELIESYNNPTKESLIAPRADDCTHCLLPSSLSRPVMKNEEYASFVLDNISTNLSNFKILIADIINDPIAGKAAVKAVGTADSVAGPYRNEYAIFLTFSASGDKVTKEEVFEDSAFTNSFYAALQAAKKQ